MRGCDPLEARAFRCARGGYYFRIRCSGNDIETAVEANAPRLPLSLFAHGTNLIAFLAFLTTLIPPGIPPANNLHLDAMAAGPATWKLVLTAKSLIV